MTAICGVVGLEGRPWTQRHLLGVVQTLRGLGPDAEGGWEGVVGGFHVAVAAALRQATPEDAHDVQPAVSPDGAVVLVADVRLDNRDALGAGLGVPATATIPDSAFLLAAYDRWGKACVQRLQGEFAFAVVDRRRAGVFLARDHVGAKPLVIHERNGVLAFASVALALTALDGVGHALDVERAAQLLALAYASDRTLVAGVRWFPPGTCLWVDRHGAERFTWWSPDPHEVEDLGSAAAHERELRKTFEQAVRARLRSVGRVGAAVSGGLDSSSAAATAALLIAPEPLPTYTSAPPPDWHGAARVGWDADDSPFVLDLAALHPNMVPSFVHVPRGESVLDLQEPLWELGASPVRNPANALWWQRLARRAAADGVTTLFSGGAGNLFFSAGGPDWLRALLRTGRVAAVLQQAAAWSRASGDGLPYTLGRHLLYASLPGPLQRVLRRAAGKTERRDEWLATTAVRPEIAAALDLDVLVPYLNERRRWDGRAIALAVARHGATQSDSAAALAALTGVEERDPTLDRRVLEIAMRQPEWVRRRDGLDRAAARGAMADRLPRVIVDRTRRGEQLPDWLDVLSAARRELAGEVEALAQHPVSRDLIDVPRLQALIAHWPSLESRTEPVVTRDYRHALLRALVISRYLRWFEGRAASLKAIAA